jgi:hypothetical protein
MEATASVSVALMERALEGTKRLGWFRRLDDGPRPSDADPSREHDIYEGELSYPDAPVVDDALRPYAGAITLTWARVRASAIRWS